MQSLEEAGTLSDTLAEALLCKVVNEVKVKEKRRSKDSRKADDSDPIGL